MNHKVVSENEWIEARKELLVKEKEHSRLRDEITRLRQQLPWHRVETDYVFESSDGTCRLSELFGANSQLITYHFMFGPDWPEGCKICSMLGDHYDPLVVHLQARDVSLVTVSRAPVEKLEEFRKRMGWSFPWVSSLNNQFNRDFGVTFTQEELDASRMNYNYKIGKFPTTECPGISCFFKNSQGEVFHTYSAYARGLENLLGIYSFLDLVAKGREEDGLPYGMHWVRHHDRYADDSFVDPYVKLVT
ncbi:MAG: thioredoxin family protein [Planctomycetota bacterium]|nr:thioredoxin family protein [Planctomycetota bacterium]